MAQKAFLFIFYNDKRDVCKTVDRTTQTANKVGFYSKEFSIHQGFSSIKDSWGLEKYHNVKCTDRAGVRRQDLHTKQ